jgi:exportin-7
LKIVENHFCLQLAWLVYIIGSAVGGRVSITSCDEHDALDGDLIIKVLMLMDLVNGRLEKGQGRSQCIDLALLQFFDQFRKIYIGDQVHKSSRAYQRLSEVVNLQDEADILDVLVKKIIVNLKFWGDDEKILVRFYNCLDLTVFFVINLLYFCVFQKK